MGLIAAGVLVFGFSVHDGLALIATLSRNEAIAEANNALFGAIGLGLCLSLLGAVLLLPDEPQKPTSPAAPILFAGVLTSLAVAIVLLVTGPFLMSLVMTSHGYKPCRTWHGVRMSITTWTHADSACAAATTR
jgi:membrane-bound ClpP family serine protease